LKARIVLSYAEKGNGFNRDEYCRSNGQQSRAPSADAWDWASKFGMIIKVFRENDTTVGALLGDDIIYSPGGWGTTVAQALVDLAAELRF
jgi:hypothetical protein